MKKLKSIIALTVFAVSNLAMIPPANAINLNDLFGNSSSNKVKFLSVDKAFHVNPTIQEDKLIVRFDITKGHYIYRDKLKLTLPDGMTASKFTFDQKPYFVDDPTFGKVAVFDNESVTATTTLKDAKDSVTSALATFQWQGCAKAGLCYPPEKIELNVNLKKK